MIGRKLSNFHINERIGEGGMGTVYKATDLHLKRTVAIKMLHPFLVNNPDSFKRFQNEAHLSARISHPNVATLFNFREVDHSHFIVMEFVEGKALDDVLKLQGEIPEEEAVKICIQVLEGLGAAHDLGIMHRDLKPGNIMITQRGFVKLMDFGIARLENTERMTRQNSVIGTLEYLAPELVTGGAPSKSSDLYAVGVMLYEMLSGKSLYAGDSEAALMYNIAHKSPTFNLQGHNRKLVQIIKKLTHKQAGKRYQSTDEAVRELESIHRNAKIDTRLLSQRIEKKESRKSPAIPVTLPVRNFSFSKLKDTKLPFDIDLRILAGAALLCLFILIMGLFGGDDQGTDPIDPRQRSVEDKRELVQEGNENDSRLLGSNTVLPQQASPQEIEFIEKFDSAPKEKEETKSGNGQRSLRKDSREKESNKSNENKSGSETKKTSTTQVEKSPDRIVEKEEKKPIQKTVREERIEEEPKPPVAREQESKPIVKESKYKGSVKVRIPDMYLAASFAETVSTETHSSGQTVYLQTISPIYQGDHLIIPKGARVRAEIKKLRRSEGKKKAFLAIQLHSVQASNGRWLAISYPEYSNLSKTVVSFNRGQRINKIKLKSTNIILNY
ncbi:MAG: protein kinase [Bacteroidia bacterium]|nr:protein kinase [Bacteroidia bacterium]